MTAGNIRKLSLKGSFTIEASIVFSLVFLLSVVLVYAFIIMYQFTVIKSVANETANRGACFYVNQIGFDAGFPVKNNLYWRIYDTNADSKIKTIKAYAAQNLELSLIAVDKTIIASSGYSFLTKHLNIVAEEKYPLPVGDILDVFGIPSDIVIRTQASAPFEDNAEFVRNLDMVIDIKNCLVNSDNKWVGSGSKVNEVLDKLLKKH